MFFFSFTKKTLFTGAELSSTDINGNTALHLAVSIPNEEITTMLLDFGIDIDTTNKV